MSRPSSNSNATLIVSLSNLTRTVPAEEPDLDGVLRNAQNVVDDLEIASPPLSLTFVEGAAFRDRQWVESTPQVYEHSLNLTDRLAKQKAYGIRFRNVPTIESVLTLARTLSKGAIRDSLSASAEIHLMEIPTKVDTPEVDVALAIETVSLLRERPWNWGLCLKVIRHLENALLNDADLALRSLTQLDSFEVWDVYRRATLAAFHVMVLLRRVDARQGDRRSAGHAALLIALAGLEERGGHDLSHAATHALKALIEHSEAPQLALEPHRLQVCALLSALMPQGVTHALAPPLALVYELERLRCPANVDIALEEVDLLALMMDVSFSQKPYGSDFPVWTHILLETLGILPAGTAIRVEHQVGVIVGQGETPRRPFISISDSILNVERNVELLGPSERWQNRGEPRPFNID